MAQTYTIHVHAIPLSDNDDGRKNAVSSEKFEKALEDATEIFKPANIRFAFDANTDWKPRKSTALNSLNNGEPGNWWEAGNQVAAQHRGKLVIFLRYGAQNSENTPASNWFAYPPNTNQAIPSSAKLPTDNVDFVVVTNQASKFGSRAGEVLAHEIGHYLGLFHTHPGWGTPETANVIKLAETKGADGLNGDLLSDTFPDPGPAYYKEKVDSNPCNGPNSFKIANVSFRPDRSNVMSYFRCPPISISPQQIAVVRKTLDHTFRAHLIAASKGTRFLGVFRAGTDDHALWVGNDWDGFKTKWEEFSKKGLRLIDLETYVQGSTRKYAGVFRAGTDDHALWVGDDWDGFKTKWEEFSKKGLRLIDLETYVEGSTRKYAGVFRAGTDDHALWVGDDWDGFKAKWEELSKKGLRLIDLETYVQGSTRKYAGVFRAGTDGHALWVSNDWDGFKVKWTELSKKGLRLVDLKTYVEGSTRKYAGVFRAGTDDHALRVGDDWDGFTAKWTELSKKGLRLVDLEVYGTSVS